MRSSTVLLRFTMEKCWICYLKYIIEGYDNAAVLSTVDSDEGLMSLSIAPGCERFIMEIVDDLSTKIFIRIANPYAEVK